MAFWNRPKRSRAFIASAQPATHERGKSASPGPPKRWQDEAWQMYGDGDQASGLGEYRQGVTWLGNVLSRARLVPALAPRQPGDEPEVIDPETGDPSVELVSRIAGGIGGQSELLRSGAVHLTVAGEGWFVGEGADEDTSWKFYSRDEVRKRRSKGGDVMQIRADESTWIDLPEESLPIRVWRPHDRYHWKATASTQAALPIMRRLELLNRKVDAQLQSRLGSNGVYWIPAEADFVAKEGYEDEPDPFIAELLDYWTTAIQTPGSAAAAVPFVGRMAADLIAKLRYDEFGKLLDPELRADREFEIRRLSTAMDVPPEVLLGLVNANHWQAWQIEESALKTTVTNLLELICWAVTTGYLWPGLAADRDTFPAVPFDREREELDPDARRIVWYDLTELAIRPDRSADTITLWKDLAVSDETLMRETGLSMSDLLVNDDERRRRIGLFLVRQPTTAAIGLELLGISTAAKVELRGPGEGEVAPGIGDIEPTNEGDLPRNDGERTPPSTNGEAPAREPEGVQP